MGVKHNDTELNITFERELKSIEIKPEDPDPDDILEKLASKNPQDAIKKSWHQIEEAAEIKSKELSLTGAQSANFRADKALRHIECSGVFSPVIKQALSQLSRLCSEMKNNPEGSISSEVTLNYIRVARVIIKQIQSLATIPQFKLTSLTYLMLEYNALLDSQKYNYISVADIHREIESHSVLRYIAKEAVEDVDLSLILVSDDPSDFENKYSEQLDWIYGGYAGQERRKWGGRKFWLMFTYSLDK